MKRFSSIAAAVLLCLPRPAAAQGFINPFVATTLTSPSPSGGSSKPGFGIAFGGIGKVVGGETEIAFFPELIDKDANGLAKSRVVTFAGDMLIGPTIGPVKVYGAFGAGNLHLNVTSLSSVVVPTAATISNNYFTFNAGGGVMGFFLPHLGARADLRYSRAFGFKTEDIENTGLSFDRFDFWRATIGIVAKF